MPQTESIIGCLLGTALGDAIGLPSEGLSRQRIRKIAPKIDGHRFFFGKGMVSDDTEHTCKDLWPCPRSVNWIEALGQRLAIVAENGVVKSALSLPVYAIIAGNLLFFLSSSSFSQLSSLISSLLR